MKSLRSHLLLFCAVKMAEDEHVDVDGPGSEEGSSQDSPFSDPHVLSRAEQFAEFVKGFKVAPDHMKESDLRKLFAKLDDEGLALFLALSNFSKKEQKKKSKPSKVPKKMSDEHEEFMNW